jgi:hypothetical protein
MAEWNIDEIIPADEVMIPDPIIARQVVLKTLRTLDNWDDNPKMRELGWPAPVLINNKKHRPLGALRAFLKNLKGGGNVDETA